MSVFTPGFLVLMIVTLPIWGSVYLTKNVIDKTKEGVRSIRARQVGKEGE
jgi:hypothetical protein